MATTSFDTVFELQPQYVESFFDAVEKVSKQPPPRGPYVNDEEHKRGVELLKKYYSR